MPYLLTIELNMTAYGIADIVNISIDPEFSNISAVDDEIVADVKIEL